MSIIKDNDKEIPNGWGRHTIGDIADLVSRRGPQGSVPYLEIGDIDVVNKLYALKAKSSPGICLCSEAGDVLVSKVRPTRGAIVYIDNQIYTSPAFSVLRAKGNNRYLFYSLTRQNFINYLGLREIGTTYPSCDDQDVLEYKISLPESTNEQSKIAEILAICDEAINKTDAKIEKLKKIKQGLMQDLFRYGIDENGQIRSESTHRFKDSPLGRIPEEWGVGELKKSNKVVVGYVGPIEQYYVNSDIDSIPLFSTTNIQKGKFEDHSNKFVTKAFDEKNIKSRIEGGDLILARHGESGSVALIPDDITRAQCLNVVVIKSSASTISSFLAYLFNFGQFNDRLLAAKAGSVQGVINTQIIKDLKIIKPSKPEQSRITTILSSSDEAIEKEEVYKQKLMKLKSGLMEDLLSGTVRVNHLIGEAS